MTIPMEASKRPEIRRMRPMPTRSTGDRTPSAGTQGRNRNLALTLILGTAISFAGLMAAPKAGATRCTDQINYAGDPRSNAEINSIGATTGVCPAPLSDASNAPAQYVSTMSGEVRCGIKATQVACNRTAGEGFLQAPTSGKPAGWHWGMATISPDGSFNWVDGNIGGAYINQDITMNYGQSYTYNGWTLLASSDGTRITNNATGHGMFVSIQNTYPF